MENIIHVTILHQHRKAFVSHLLKSYGALSTFYVIILILDGNEGMNQEQITSILKMDKASTSNAVKQLLAEGYVLRQTSRDDRRVNQIYLTPKAKSLIPEIRGAIQAWNSKIMEGIPPEQQSLFQELLKHMANRAVDPQKEDRAYD